MANALLVSESTLTDRYQTTVPDAVRKALHLNKREKSATPSSLMAMCCCHVRIKTSPILLWIVF